MAHPSLTGIPAEARLNVYRQSPYRALEAVTGASPLTASESPDAFNERFKSLFEVHLPRVEVDASFKAHRESLQKRAVLQADEPGPQPTALPPVAHGARPAADSFSAMIEQSRDQIRIMFGLKDTMNEVSQVLQINPRTRPATVDRSRTVVRFVNGVAEGKSSPVAYSEAVNQETIDAHRLGLLVATAEDRQRQVMQTVRDLPV
jgi:hypothetical protein